MGIEQVVLESDNQVKKSLFDFGHDLNSTFSWGELQPTNCQLVPTPSHCRFRISSLVRCFPLLSPVFGRVSYKQFHNFISFSDIFPKWKEVLSNQKSLTWNYNPDNLASNTWNSSIIAHFPQITPDALLYALLRGRSYGQFYQRQTSDTPSSTDLNNPNVAFSWNPSASWSVFREKAWQNFPHSTNAISPFITSAANVSSPCYFTPADADFRSFGKMDKSGVNINFMATFKLNSAGRRLLKILRGLGYYVSFRSSSNALGQSLLPLLAWYRAYWCNFGIPQYEVWENTYAYKLIEHFSHVDENNGDARHLTLSTITLSKAWDYFFGFMDELCDCFYVDTKQLESIAIDIPSLNTNTLSSNPFANTLFFRNGSAYVQQDSLQKNNATWNGSLVDGFSQVEDDLLKLMYIYANKSSSWGSDIATALKNRGFTDFVNDCGTHYLGSDAISVDISEVTMQGDTDVRQLGSPAGRGVGFGKNKYINFDTHEPGYFISMACVVPICKTTQTMDLTLLGTKFDTFFSPLLDAVGQMSMPYVGVGFSEGVSHIEDEDSLVEEGNFGLYPRFTEFKTKKNVLNGAFANPSELDSMSSYSLDRLVIRNPFNLRDLNASNGSFKSRRLKGLRITRRSRE